MSFNYYYKKAKALKKDANTPIYQDLQGFPIKETFIEYYGSEEPTAASLFMSRNSASAKYMNGTLYISSSKYDEDGKILPKGVYHHKLMFHKPYARTDKEVKTVVYKIVGLKRASTKLPAAVLVKVEKWGI